MPGLSPETSQPQNVWDVHGDGKLMARFYGRGVSEGLNQGVTFSACWSPDPVRAWGFLWIQLEQSHHYPPCHAKSQDVC
jgi:hypothetical protein